MRRLKKVAFLLIIVGMLIPFAFAIAAELTSSDVAVTVTKRRTFSGIKQNDVTINLNKGLNTNTYPTGGIPMPAASSFGLVSSVQQMILTDTTSPMTTSSTSLCDIRWDKANNKILVYTEIGPYGVMSQISSAKSTATTSNATFKGIVIGW